MKILLIGGAGFIGSHTAQKLLLLGHSPVIFDSFDPQIHGKEGLPHVAELAKCMPVIKGDTRDRDALERVLGETEAIYYFPASTGTGQSMYRVGEYSDVNVHGAGIFGDLLLKYRTQIARVVVSSSRAVYGEGAAMCTEHGRVFPKGRNNTDMESGIFDARCPQCGNQVEPLPSLETDSVGPVSVYGITKLAQEMIVANVAEAAGIPSVVFRYQNVYGPGQSLKNPYTGILSIFTQLLLGKKAINIFEDGLPTRDFVYVGDVVEYNVRALTCTDSKSVVLNVGTGVRKTVDDLVKALGKVLSVNPDSFISGDFRLGDIRHAVADTTQLFNKLGPLEFTSLDAGVGAFASWVVSQHLSSEANSSFQHSLDEMRREGLLRTASSS